MKKIAIFTQNLSIGGVQKSVSSLANYLKEYFDIYIILAENNKEIKYNLQNTPIKEIQTKKIDIKKQGIGEEIFNYRIVELEKILHTIKPDILLSYEDYNNLIALSTSYECKKIISCRVNIDDSYHNKLIHLLDENFYFKKMKKLYPLANTIITVSQSIQNELINKFKLKNTKTIYNGISLPNRNSQDIPYKNFILNIGRLHNQKGQLDLIDAFNLIKNDISQNLVLVGDGPLKTQLYKKIKEYKLGKRVFLTGFDKPYKYILKCDLFIFPSYYEGFSNTVLEVMSSKKNIISYNYKGSEEILYKKNLVPLGDTKALSLKILYYIKNQEKNTMMENLLFEKVKQFSLSRTLENYKNEMDLLCAEL